MLNYYLIMKNIDVNIKCIKRRDSEMTECTPLHIAVKNGNVEIVKLLLENDNIDVDATDEQGRKAIDISSNQSITDLLSNHNK